MPDKSPEPATGASPNKRLLGYVGLIVGFGVVVLTVDSGSVTVQGFSFDVSVPILAALAFAGGILAGRFGPRGRDDL